MEKLNRSVLLLSLFLILVASFLLSQEALAALSKESGNCVKATGGTALCEDPVRRGDIQNLPPVFDTPANNTTFRYPARTPLAITVTAHDPEGTSVSITVAGVPSWATVDNNSNNRNPATVVISGTPPIAAVGGIGDPPFSFEATASDGVASSYISFKLFVTRFKNATSESGIFSHPGGDTADTRTVDFGDIDGDGDLDILTCTLGMHHYGWPLEDAANVPKPYFDTEYIRLYRNNGDRTFTDISDVLGYNTTIGPTERWRASGAAFVHQGSHPNRPDIMINHASIPSGFGGDATLLQNNGSGRFDDLAYPPIRRPNRENEDVMSFYSNPADATNKANWATILINSGSTTVSANSRIYDKDMVEKTEYFPPDGLAPHPECISEAGDIAAGDFDSDGDQDLILSGLAYYQDTGAFYTTDQCYHYQEGGGVQLFHSPKDRQKASLLFRNRGGAPGAVGDLEDITGMAMPYETSYPWPSSINTGIATPTWFDIYVYERHAEFADLDKDNDLDIFIADPTPGIGNTLYRDVILINDGFGFQYLPGRLNWQVYRDVDVKTGDIDLDTNPDIVLIPLKGQIKLLKPNQTLSWFVPHIEWTFPVSPADDKINNAIALGDLDNDGDLDLYLAKDGEDILYFNMTCTPTERCLLPDDSLFISQNVPPQMDPGQVYPVTLTFYNKGSNSWTQGGGHHLKSLNPGMWGVDRVNLASGETIATYQNKAFTFNVTAPATEGTYYFHWRMAKDGVGEFGEYSFNVPVQVTSLGIPPAANPASVTTDAGMPINITLRGSDPDSQYPLTFHIVTNPSKGGLGAVTPLDNTSASVLYTPDAGVSGSDSFNFKVKDTAGLESLPATVLITINPISNSPPVFTAPSEMFLRSTLDMSFSVTFAAQDPNSGNVTLSLVGTLPSWLTQTGGTNPGNPATLVFSGVPTQRDIIRPVGAPTMIRVRAMDAGGLTAEKEVYVFVPRFKEVTGNLPVDTNPTLGVDAGDIDEDGDLDLVIAHPLSASLGTRILINNGTGRFTDGTSGRLADYRTESVKLARNPLGQLDLYLSHWTNSSTAVAKRLRNTGGGFTTEEVIATNTQCSGNVPITWSYGHDIEAANVPPIGSTWERWRVFFADDARKFCSELDQSDSGVFSWNSTLTTFGYLDVFYSFIDFNPRTYDFEVTDVDGDNDEDLFAAGVAEYSEGHPVGLWSEPGVGLLGGDIFKPEKYLLYTFGYLLPWEQEWGSFSGIVQQKGQFVNLDKDLLGGRERIDLVMVDRQHGIRVFRNVRTSNGNGNFSFTENPVPINMTQEQAFKEVVVGDLDGDTYPDIIGVGNGNQPEMVFYNHTSLPDCTSMPICLTEYTGAFLPPLTTEDDSNGGLLFDMDNDGDKDLFISNNGQDRLYENLTIP